MTIAIGTKLGHYEIRSPIGAGGMGEVYLAEDTRLHRKVALKILPVDLASNQDRMRRFVQEAKAAAALNHPNIATIHEIGESDGTNFIAMEFIDGVTLREKIHHERTELRKLLRFLQHAAEGLAKAHAAGIVHRDLKPDNIMVTRDGHAKVLDFGLAKLIEPQQPQGISESTGEDPTAILQQQSTPGMIMGTVGYMSPEQAQGKTNEIDQRSDIFSFGCILFEAVTGQKPFAGDSVVKSLHMVIYESAPSIAELNPSAPSELQRIVRRCLAKDPEDRYQTIKDVAIELKELRRELQGAGIDTTVAPPTKSETTTSTGGEGTNNQSLSPTTDTASLSLRASSAEYVATGIRRHKLALAITLVVLVAGIAVFVVYIRGRNANAAINSIAVMPFENEGRNADVEYLSDGMTETLISSLSQLPNLNVKGRASVFRYKGKDVDTKTLGRELGVQAVLYGRVSQRGDLLTLSLELLDAVTENVIWSGQYDRKPAEVVSLQREIARDVSNKLKTKLSSADVAKVEKNYTDNAESYQQYLKGKFCWNKRTADALQQSVEFYKKAIEKDPRFALAYAGLAQSYVFYPGYGVGSSRESMPLAKAAALRAIELDDSLAEAHVALGIYYSTFAWNQPVAEREFRRAIELDQNYATAHQQLGIECLVIQGRFNEAIAEGKRAEELDPVSPIIAADLGNIFMRARRFDEALAQLNRVLTLDPNFWVTYWYLGMAHHGKGQYAEAVAEYRKALSLDDNPWVKALLIQSLVKGGQRSEAVKLLGELQSESARRYVTSSGLAIAYGALGEMDKAFVLLTRDVDERSTRAGMFSVNPIWDDLRDDPRFADLIKRVEASEMD